jgi:hypothetical protein
MPGRPPGHGGIGSPSLYICGIFSFELRQQLGDGPPASGTNSRQRPNRATAVMALAFHFHGRGL